MKQLFEYEAEHITHNQIVKLVKELEAQGIEVEYATSDNVLADNMFMIVRCTDAEAKQLKNRVWAINGGLFCDMVVIDQDRLNCFIED